MYFSKYNPRDNEPHDVPVPVGHSGLSAKPARVRPEESLVASAYASEVSLAESEQPGALDASARRRRWWLWAAALGIIFGILAAGAAYIFTKTTNTVDQLVILTVPSGAEITLSSKAGEKNYGLSPVKLEQVEIGSYTLKITKDGFEAIEVAINVSKLEPKQFEYRLRPVPLSETSGLSLEERLKEYRQSAEDAFGRGFYGPPWEKSALYYVDLILSIDQSNQFASDLRERIRKALLQSAQSSITRGDSARAQGIYRFLLEYYPGDDDVRVAQARLETQLSARRGEVRDLVKKAEEALQAGNLTDPPRASAYYYSNQAIAIDRQNAQALSISNQVKAALAEEGERSAARGDIDSAIRHMERVVQYFPEDRQLQSRLSELSRTKDEQSAKAADPKNRRWDGLKKYRDGYYTDAVPDLEYAMQNGQGTPEVIFALAEAHFKLGRLEQAAAYFNQVPKTSELYPSTIAALGDVAFSKGDVTRAVARYRQAIQLGGSVRYSIPELEDKIEKIEKRERDKAAAPEPVSIQVKHPHGGLRGSCKGTLTVGPTGVSYNGDDAFSANLVGVSVNVIKGELRIRDRDRSFKFEAAPYDAERFREAVTRYQNSIGK